MCVRLRSNGFGFRKSLVIYLSSIVLRRSSTKIGIFSLILSLTHTFCLSLFCSGAALPLLSAYFLVSSCSLVVYVLRKIKTLYSVGTARISTIYKCCVARTIAVLLLTAAKYTIFTVSMFVCAAVCVCIVRVCLYFKTCFHSFAFLSVFVRSPFRTIFGAFGAFVALADRRLLCFVSCASCHSHSSSSPSIHFEII